MKNTLLVPVVFISNLLVWLCLFSFFIQLNSYESLRTLSSGIYMPFLLKLVARALYLFPFSLMCALLTSYLFLMRHKSLVFISVPIVLLFTVLSVLFVIPFSYQLSEQYALFLATSDTDLGETRTVINPPGYIRSYDGNNRIIWYSTSGDRVSPVVAALNTAGADGNALKVYESALYSTETGKLSGGTTVFAQNAGGKDPLFAISLKLPLYLASAASDAGWVLDSLHTAWKYALIKYVVLAGSFFAALTALWVLAYMTGWRLLNMLLVLAGFRFLLAIYPHTTKGRLFQLVRRFLPASVDSSLVPPFLLATMVGILSAVGLALLIKKLILRNRREVFHD